MKKTLLAVTIPALFAVSANAATVYEKDGQKFDVYGRAQANIYDKEAARISGYDTSATDTTLVGTGRYWSVLVVWVLRVLLQSQSRFLPLLVVSGR